MFTVVLPGAHPPELEPFALFLFCGILPWTWFSSSLLESANVLIAGGNLIKKVLFPAEVLPIVVVLSGLVHFCLGLPILALFMIYYRVPLGPWALMAPVFFLMLLVFTVGLTLAASAVNVFYRDVNPVVQIALQLWLYLTPVAYPLAAVPARFKWLFVLNPLSAVVEGLRATLVFNRPPDAALTLISALMTVVLFGAAFVVFKRIDKYFADVI